MRAISGLPDSFAGNQRPQSLLARAGQRRADAQLGDSVGEEVTRSFGEPESHLEACSALGWVADKGDLRAIVAAIGPLKPSSAAPFSAVLVRFSIAASPRAD